MRHGRSFVSSRAGPGGRLAASLPRRVSPASSLRSISGGFFFILTFFKKNKIQEINPA
jgi:hypothetical protein